MKQDLTFEQLTNLVSEASGWGNRASITFRVDHDPGDGRTPPRTYVSAGVDICGAKATVSGHGSDHRAALVALLTNIEMHHREVMRWHAARLNRVRAILDEYDVYYVKGA